MHRLRTVRQQTDDRRVALSDAASRPLDLPRVTLLARPVDALATATQQLDVRRLDLGSAGTSERTPVTTTNVAADSRVPFIADRGVAPSGEPAALAAAVNNFAAIVGEHLRRSLAELAWARGVRVWCYRHAEGPRAPRLRSDRLGCSAVGRPSFAAQSAADCDSHDESPTDPSRRSSARSSGLATHRRDGQALSDSLDRIEHLDGQLRPSSVTKIPQREVPIALESRVPCTAARPQVRRPALGTRVLVRVVRTSGAVAWTDSRLPTRSSCRHITPFGIPVVPRVEEYSHRASPHACNATGPLAPRPRS